MEYSSGCAKGRLSEHWNYNEPSKTWYPGQRNRPTWLCKHKDQSIRSSTTTFRRDPQTKVGKVVFSLASTALISYITLFDLLLKTIHFVNSSGRSHAEPRIRLFNTDLTRRVLRWPFNIHVARQPYRKQELKQSTNERRKQNFCVSC